MRDMERWGAWGGPILMMHLLLRLSSDCTVALIGGDDAWMIWMRAATSLSLATTHLDVPRGRYGQGQSYGQWRKRSGRMNGWMEWMGSGRDGISYIIELLGRELRQSYGYDT